LQLALLAKSGLISFSGPMVASELSSGLRGITEEWFWRCLTSPKPLPGLHARSIGTPFRGQAAGGRTRRVSGRLIGGNLSVLTASVGTPYFPLLPNSVLLIEEVGERPYRIDRMLRQIKLAGILRNARGVVLGTFTDCQPERGKPSLT